MNAIKSFILRYYYVVIFINYKRTSQSSIFFNNSYDHSFNYHDGIIPSLEMAIPHIPQLFKIFWPGYEPRKEIQIPKIE